MGSRIPLDSTRVSAGKSGLVMAGDQAVEQSYAEAGSALGNRRLVLGRPGHAGDARHRQAPPTHSGGAWARPVGRDCRPLGRRRAAFVMRLVLSSGIIDPIGRPSEVSG